MSTFGTAHTPTLALSAAPSTWRKVLGAVERRKWSGVAHRRLIPAVEAMLLDPDLRGMLLEGPEGSGKSSLGYEIARSRPDLHVVILSGTHALRGKPLGIFLKYLDRIPDSADPVPAEVIPPLSQAIAEEARGRTTLLFVDDIHRIDTASLSVIVHLVLSGRSKLLATAPRTRDVHSSLGWLVRDGLIVQHRMAPLNRSESRQLILQSTGHPISEAALSALLQHRGRSALTMQALFGEQVEQRRIELQSGHWISTHPLAIEPRGPVARLMAARLQREPEELQKALVKIALLHRAPWRLAAAVVGVTTLVELEERGHLMVETSRDRHVSLKDFFLAESIRVGSHEKASGELLAEINLAAGGSLMELEPSELLVLGQWLLDSGQELDAGLRLGIADHALANSRPLLAIRVLRDFPEDHGRAVEARVLTATAYFALAEPEKAWAVIAPVDVEAFAAGASGPAALALATMVQQTRVRCHLELFGDHQAARDEVTTLEGLIRRFEEKDRSGWKRTAGDGKHLSVAERLLLAGLEIRFHQGDFRTVGPELESLWASPDASEEMRLVCGGFLVMCHAAMGREDDAIRLSGEVAERLRLAPQDYKVREVHLEGRVLALIWSGRWLECIDELQELLEASGQDAMFRGGVMELGVGLAHCFAGKSDQSIEILASSIAQLEAERASGYLCVALSALAFSHASAGNEEAAREILARLGRLETAMNWANRFMTEFFVRMARLSMNDLEAARLLVSSGLEDLEEGRVTAASLSLFGAKYYNNNREIEAVRTAGLLRQGAMGRITAGWASAVLQRDPQRALDAATAAEKLQLQAVEYRCAAVALELAKENASSVSLASARAHLQSAESAGLVNRTLVSVSHGGHLTHRELQVARLAEQGLGNRDIARRIGISVRTVEGHLYQAFAKLGVTSRQQLDSLSAALSDAAPSGQPAPEHE